MSENLSPSHRHRHGHGHGHGRQRLRGRRRRRHLGDGDGHTSESSSPSFYINWQFKLYACILFLHMLVNLQPCAAEKNKVYHMQTLCKSHFLQQVYRKIDGAVLWSQNERNLDCIITFQTHSILQRFMIRFDLLQLDCNDHLYIFDGAHANNDHKADLSCRNTKQSVGAIFTKTNYLTLKYLTDGWGTDSNGFKMVITVIKDPKHACNDFRCSLHEFCIHPELTCDGINHCADGSDETIGTLCHGQESGTFFGVELSWFVLASVCITLIFCASVVGLIIYVCRRRTPENELNTSLQLHPNMEINGSSYKHHHGGTLQRDNISTLPSGNVHHPAGPLGYRLVKHNKRQQQQQQQQQHIQQQQQQVQQQQQQQLQHKSLMAKVRPIWCLAKY